MQISSIITQNRLMHTTFR